MFLVILAFAASAAACTSQSTYDYLMLVTQWAPTACMPQNFDCTTYGQIFTLHGLWPDNYDGTYPCDCTSEAFDPNSISSILTEMQKFWPSYSSSGDTSFWEHEWSKHGTCATANATIIPNQADFFKDTLGLRTKYDPADALAQGSLRPSDTNTIASQHFLTVLAQGLGAQPAIECDSKGNIEQVTVCITAGMQAFDCPNSVTPNQCPTELTYPATNKAALFNATL